MLFIFYCCNDEENYMDRGYFGCSRKDLENSITCTDNSEHVSEAVEYTKSGGIFVVS